MKQFYFIVFSVILFSACNNNTQSNNNNSNTSDTDNPPPPLINYSIVKVYPHDTTSYTQGLQWVNNSLIEGTGNYGHSKLIDESLDGKESKAVDLDKIYFGEGITVLNDKIYQLTWKENKVFVYDAATFKKINEFTWPYEGWGLTNNGTDLIISTGSSNLYFVDPETFKIKKQIGVFDNYGPVSFLNELEYIKGSVFANQYETNNILKINPETGNVEGKLDCTNLLQQSGMQFNTAKYDINSGNVLNGIAFDSTKNSLYITGKLWPALFEIKLN